jgi:hypothetical protein
MTLIIIKGRHNGEIKPRDKERRKAGLILMPRIKNQEAAALGIKCRLALLIDLDT